MESDVIKTMDPDVVTSKKSDLISTEVPSDDQCVANSDKEEKLVEEKSLDEGCIFSLEHCLCKSFCLRFSLMSNVV